MTRSDNPHPKPPKTRPTQGQLRYDEWERYGSGIGTENRTEGQEAHQAL